MLRKKKKEKRNKSLRKKSVVVLPSNGSSPKYNKTLVVGHTLSNYEDVLKLLHANGMENADPIVHKNIDAQEISDVLLKANTKKMHVSSSITVPPIWNGLAMDLFMSNVNKKWWGWADSKAISFLNYWKDTDAQMAFVLVYNTPQNFIHQHISDNKKISHKKLQKNFDAWCDYNRQVLDFYYRNKDKALLVNAQQVNADSQICIEQLQGQIGIVSKKKAKKKKLNVNAYYHKVTQVQEHAAVDPTLSYLVDELLQEYPRINEIYEELQSVSNVPLLLREEKEYDPLVSINALTKKTRKMQTLKEKGESEKKKSEDELQELKDVLENKLTSTEKESDKEQELLLTQLHLVQEELENYFLENISVKEKLSDQEANALSLKTELQTKEKALSQENALLLQETQTLKKQAEAETKKMEESFSNANAQLEKKLDSTKKGLNEENELLLTQLHLVQEELEKYYLENKNLKEKALESKRYYGAAERIKSQLSYRLGAKMIEKSKSFFGILGLPFSLLEVRSAFRKEKKENAGVTLPPIETYADAYEAERVKKHLSYMLGQVTIKTMKNPFCIFILPFRLSATHKAFKESRSAS